MDIVVTARHTTVSDRFRRHLKEKLEKAELFGQRIDRIEVCIDHEANPRLAEQSERIEVTVRQPRSVIRAEATAGDLYGALDRVQDKLVERLRRARDRAKPHHLHKRGHHVEPPPSAAALEAMIKEQRLAPETEVEDYSPVVIRRKSHKAAPMSLDDALNKMELVGHDFYLFEDDQTGRPSVVYRRRGWSYGVIDLVTQEHTEIDIADSLNGRSAGDAEIVLAESV